MKNPVKKILCTVMALLVVGTSGVVFTGCGSDNSKDSSSSKEKTTTEVTKATNSEGEEYEEIELNQYEQYKYYYTSGDSFICDKDKTVKNIQYYELSEENEKNNITKCDVDLDFEINKYYEKISIPESID